MVTCPLLSAIPVSSNRGTDVAVSNTDFSLVAMWVTNFRSSVISISLLNLSKTTVRRAFF